MANHPATLQVRMPIAQREAIDWYAEGVGCSTATAARFFLPKRIPDISGETTDPGEVAETLERLKAYAQVELDGEIAAADSSRPAPTQ